METPSLNPPWPGGIPWPQVKKLGPGGWTAKVRPEPRRDILQHQTEGSTTHVTYGTNKEFMVELLKCRLYSLAICSLRKIPTCWRSIYIYISRHGWVQVIWYMSSENNHVEYQRRFQWINMGKIMELHEISNCYVWSVWWRRRVSLLNIVYIYIYIHVHECCWTLISTWFQN